MHLNNHESARRRGVILMVVLALLTLFAIIGVTFVLYASSEETASRVAKDSEEVFRPNVEPETALAMFLAQLLYDVGDDSAGMTSAWRGHSLARGMYGYTSPAVGSTGAMPEDKPYIGPGKLHYVSSYGAADKVTYAGDDAFLVNFQYFGQVNPATGTLVAGKGETFVRDPERFGVRSTGGATPVTDPNLNAALLNTPTSTTDYRGPYTGGWHAPYTYPDHNNMFLALVRSSDGMVLAPSGHRPYIWDPNSYNATPPASGAGQGTGNGNWTNTEGKHLTMFVRAADMATGFPSPDANGLSVKNLDNGPGSLTFQVTVNPAATPPITWTPVTTPNDSGWIDIGAPVTVAPNGKKYKMLVAPLIMELDSRINLNAAGNVIGYNPVTKLSAHASNQGWGPTELNLGMVLSAAGSGTNPEWQNLFMGNANPGNFMVPASATGSRNYGRYGAGRLPAGGNLAGGTSSRTWGPVDLNGIQDPWNSNLGATLPTLLPSAAPYNAAGQVQPYATFPAFGAGYGNGIYLETTHTGMATGTAMHPLIYNSQVPGVPTNRLIPVKDMAQLLRLYGTNTDALTSDLFRLCPSNFIGTGITDAAALARRRQVTLLSAAMDCIAGTPYILDPTPPTTFTTPPPLAAFQFPVTYASPSWSPATPTGQTPLNYPTPPPPGTGVNAAGEFNSANFRSRIADVLWRIDLNRSLAAYPTPEATSGMFDTATPNSPASLPTIQQAIQDRQALAQDIFTALREACGIQDPNTVYTSTASTPNSGQITGATNAAPISITTTNPHNLTTGQVVIVTGVQGNTAANGTWTVTMSSPTMFTLNGSDGTTSGAYTANTGTFTYENPQFFALRYLAQIAVNIVDFIDYDDYSTPFQWLNSPGVVGGVPGPYSEYVYGTELPRLVLNEIYAEYTNDKNDPSLPAAASYYNINFTVELMNPMINGITSNPNDTTGKDASGNPWPDTNAILYATPPASSTSKVSWANYLVVLASQNAFQTGSSLDTSVLRHPANVTGDPDFPLPSTYTLNTTGTLPPPAETYAPPSPPSQSNVGQYYNAPGTKLYSVVGAAPSGATQPSATDYLPTSQPTLPSGNTTAPNYGATMVPGDYRVVTPNNNQYGVNAATANNTYNAGFYVLGADPSNYPTTLATNPTPPSFPVTTFRPEMTLQVPAPAAGTTTVPGATVLLRRLACPGLPPNDPANTTTYNPALPPNPYLTIDYVTLQPGNIYNNVKVYGPAGAFTNAGTTYNSYGRTQPYAANSSLSGTATTSYMWPAQAAKTPITAQPPTGVTLPPPPNTTFYRQNAVEDTGPPATATTETVKVPFDWLVHLDRQVISPMELLNVSGYKPQELTQQFVTPTPSFTPPATGPAIDFGVPFSHLAPWKDPSARLYRFFEFVQTKPRAAGVTRGGRIPGKININMLWDTDLNIWRALCDSEVVQGTVASTTPGSPDLVTTSAAHNLVTGQMVFINGVTGDTVANGVWTITVPVGSTTTFTLNGSTGTVAGTGGTWTALNAEFFSNNSFYIDNTGKVQFSPDVPNIFGRFRAQRTPLSLTGGTTTAVVPSAGDRPFWGFSIGNYNPTAPASPPTTNYLDNLDPNYVALQAWLGPPAGTGTAPGPTIRGIDNTLLAGSGAVGSSATTQRLFDPYPADSGLQLPMNPYRRNQLLNKIFNNVTTHSNVFAVWLTVGFFEVGTDAATGLSGDNFLPVKLGAEVGASEGRQVRHRMFAIVDRSQMVAFSTSLTTATTTTTRTQSGPVLSAAAGTVATTTQINSPNHGLTTGQTVYISGVQGDTSANGFWTITQVDNNNFTIPVAPNAAYTTGGTWVTATALALKATSGNNLNGRAWALPTTAGTGVALTLDPYTANEETVFVQYDTVSKTYFTTTNIANAHAALATVICRGNPGPWQWTNTDGYNPRNDPVVVPFFAVID
jgi:hypothetical protein